MRFAFTDLALQRLKTPGYHWDLVLPGFGIAIGRKARTFITIYNGRRTRLGRYPSFKLSEARKQAALILARNPSTTKQITVSEAVEEYLHNLKLRPNTQKNYMRLLRRHLSDNIGNNPILTVTAHEILAITDAVKKKPSECLHAHVVMGTFFNWCIPRYLSASPMTALKAPTKAKSRNRVLSYEQLKKIWDASFQLNTFGIIIRLCILLGQRSGEIANIHRATWNDATITWPGELTKNHRQHSLKLTTYTLSLVKELIEQLPTKLHWNTCKTRLDLLSGVESYVIHDLRRTWSTHVSELGVLPHIVERVLNHVSGEISGVAAIYNRAKYLDDIHNALELWERTLIERGVIT